MSRNGFTLVELLVVIAMLALAAGVVVLTVGSPGDGPADGAARFASRMAAARDEAIVTGRPVRAWFSASGYGFEQYREGHWQPLSARPFRTEDWPAGMSVRSEGGAQDGLVRLSFDTLGMADGPLSVRLVREGQGARVRIASNGDVVVE